MWAVWREEEEAVTTGSDGVLYSLGLVEFGIVHEKNAAPVLETGEELVFQKFGKGLLVVSTAFEMIRQDARLVKSNDQRHVWATVVGHSLEGTSTTGSAAILAGDVQIEASLINVHKVVHVARAVENALSPLSTALDTFGIVISLWLGPHELERVGSELVDGLVNATLGEGRFDLKVFVQLVGEPLNRATSEFINVLSEPIEMFLLDPTSTVATSRQLGHATGVEKGVDNTSNSRSGDTESVSHRSHGPALISDKTNDPLPRRVVDCVIFPSSNGRHYDMLKKNV